MKKILFIAIVPLALVALFYFYQKDVNPEVLGHVTPQGHVSVDVVIDHRFRDEQVPDSTGSIVEQAVTKSLQGLVEGKPIEDSISQEEMDALAEIVKKTDHQYQEQLILSKNPKLKAFRGLFYKVLKDNENRQAYSEMLGDKNLANEVSDSLNNVGNEFVFKDQVARIIYVDLLNEMISHSKETGDGYIHSIVSDVLTSDIVFDKSLPDELRRSLYGDRIEVFKRYAKVYHEDAVVVMNQIPHSKYREYLEDITNQTEEKK